MPLLNGYGITECSPGISGVRADAAAQPTARSARILPGIEAPDRGPRRQRRSPTVRSASCMSRGPNVMLRLLPRTGATAAAIDRDGWFNTGDLARFERRGAVYIVGRTKELIIRSGFNVYPAEVEAVLNAHPSVVQSAVVGRAVEGNEEVVAFVQLLPGSEDHRRRADGARRPRS